MSVKRGQAELVRAPSRPPKAKAGRVKGKTICLATGKTRYRDGHQAALALRSQQRRRSAAELVGATHRIGVQRKYACPSCGGWHLTSQLLFT
jgi:hypothetical protein